jgi:hypothetical protein
MIELLTSCADDLLQPATPECATDYGERVVQIILGEEFPIEGNIPTALEFQTAYSNGTITIIRGITNGHRVFISQTTIEGLYGTEHWDKKYRVEGNIRRIDEDIARSCEQLDRALGLSLWYITENNYCFGGYTVNPSFSEIIKEGVGTRPYIQFAMEYFGVGADYALQDDYDFENVVGLGISYPGIGLINYPEAGIITH